MGRFPAQTRSRPPCRLTKRARLSTDCADEAAEAPSGPRLSVVKVRTTRPAALSVTFPFTRAGARAAGVGIKSLRSALYQRLFYDLYVASDIAVTPELRARAALRVAGVGAHASHFTAAQIWGIPVPRDSDTHVTVTRREERCVRQGIKSHLRNSGSITTVRSGIPVSTPEQTFLDLAATGMDLIDLVIVGDMMGEGEVDHHRRAERSRGRVDWSTRP